MSLLTCFFATTVLFILEMLYFKIADRYNIIDHPNHRSSHSQVTIRGGGIIFSISLLISPLYIGLNYAYFLIGLFLISLVSFIDDVKTIGTGIRICVHLIAVTLLFYQLGLYGAPVYLICIAFFVCIGIINAINFMDGINGISGLYGLVTLTTLYYINTFIKAFTSSDFLLTTILSTLVFIFFNFRNKAKCFAGDVGSVSLAFILLFFILQLITKTNNLNYVLFLLLYGLDTSTTILFRILRKEKISEAHRSHFYQFLVNEKKLPHLIVAGIYAIIQVVINIIVIVFSPKSNCFLILLTVALMGVFVCFRLLTEGKGRLLTKHG